MLAANWDRPLWDEHKLELWLGMIGEVKADGSKLYGAREARWAAHFLIREHQYPSVQFSDFHRAVLSHRFRLKQRARLLKDRAEAAEWARRKSGKLISIASLLQLAAPREMPT